MTIEQMTRDAVEEAKRPDAGAGTARWRNRIVWAATAAPRDLAADRSNWRAHPRHQRDAPVGSLDTGRMSLTTGMVPIA